MCIRDRSWSASPVYDYLRQAYLINAQYITRMAEAAPLADGQAKTRMRFMTRQMAVSYTHLDVYKRQVFQ